MTIYAYLFGLAAILLIFIVAVSHVIMKNQEQIFNKLIEIEKLIKLREKNK